MKVKRIDTNVLFLASEEMLLDSHHSVHKELKKINKKKANNLINKYESELNRLFNSWNSFNRFHYSI
jgi:hypothetical protein